VTTTRGCGRRLRTVNGLERANREDAPEYQPVVRTVGTGLPGYGSGAFRLRNGEQALAYLTSKQGVVHIPTIDGYALLLSVAQPELLLRIPRDRARATKE